MTNSIEVALCIQARSTSTRFPKKIFELIGNKRILDHVIAQAESVAGHLSRKYTTNVHATIAILHPEGDDEIVNAFKTAPAVFIAGSEQDVLSRFVKAQAFLKADYIVRLTSDCPMLLDFMISKCIFTAIFNQYDYVSNVEEKCRMTADGFDVEVISAKGLAWANANSQTEFDREHVTTKIREKRPSELKQAFVSSKIDTSDMKLSVDTPEDLERVRQFYHSRQFKMDMARRIFGRHVYEL